MGNTDFEQEKTERTEVNELAESLWQNDRRERLKWREEKRKCEWVKKPKLTTN
jgi:hypothetical protein